ncbi:MAG: pyridoxal phosphate-dependent aminotransferase [Polyangiales bacterium]
MTLRFSHRADDIAPFLAMEVMERGMTMARAGHSIVQMGVGEPDFDAPPEAVDETIRALRSGETHYTDSRGLYTLREAIADDCAKRRGVRPDPDQIVVTMGTSPAILTVLGLLVGPGDEVIMPTPHYPCYPNMVATFGGRSVLVPTSNADGFVIDVARIRAAITPRTKAILFASPANPTGAVQPPEVVRELASLGIPLLSDEIYDGLLYDGSVATSPFGLSDEVFVLDGFSKRYAMTGFRLGYVIAPKAAMRPLVSMQQSYFISATHFVQEAGIAALRDGAPHLERMRALYERRRDLLVAGLRRLGLGLPVAPKGAFYVLADARRFGDVSLDLAFRILEEAKVAVGPGRDFGEIAEGYLRFSFATSEENIAEGLRRLEPVLAGLARS